jgi:hypothetical protein
VLEEDDEFEEFAVQGEQAAAFTQDIRDTFFC